MKILIVDCTIDRGSWGSPELARISSLAPSATVSVRRAPEGDLPESPDAYDRVIVSGSKTRALDDAPWISKLHEFIRRSVERKKPFLGVCYGHQSLVRAFGGKEAVRVASRSEHGWTKIEVLEESSLLRGLKKGFHSFSSHYDEVASLPRAFRRLARSEACEIQACALESAPAYGIQFHPEKNLEEAKRSIQGWKKSKAPKVDVMHPEKSETLYDPEVAQKLFRNFLEL